ncbi:NUDIX domain-containing protein, partial [Streptomyces sp. SPB074]|uniref:NUDIX domain-containing protein n=1 Tax=Streptomyces sp. (strain SPB074) TaxID=465543 RepID=UPI0001D1DCEE
MSRTHSTPDGSGGAPACAGPQPFSHCSSCGAPYAEARSWPRTCAVCGATAYGNPLPVAVALQPVYDRAGTGLVVITRAIEPAKGTVALPGGFVDHDEDWRHAVVRELREETGIETEPRDVRLADALSSSDGHLLLFG